MHITITGKLGSGKSTVCHLIEERYGFEIFSTGSIMREAALKMGISITELNDRIKTDPSLDDLIDKTTVRISRERKDERIIFDSRMAWHFAEDTFKIFMVVDPMVAATRVMANPRGAEEQYASVEEACNTLIKRSLLEQARFKSLYGVDYYDYNNYNLVVDTGKLDPEAVADVIWESYNAYLVDPVANGHREVI